MRRSTNMKSKQRGEIHGPVKAVINLYGEAEHKDMVKLGSIKLA